MAGEWTSLAMSKYFGDRHRETINERLKRLRARANDPRIELVGRMDQLEDDFGRALLLIQALVETCFAKGVLGPEELAEMARKVDLADGAADGKLDPEVFRQGKTKGRPPAGSPEEHLRRLEEES